MTDNADLGEFMHVALSVTAEVGHCSMRLGEVLQLGKGAVVTLDRSAGSPIDLLVNDELIARGELVAVDDRYGVRITQVVAKSRHPP